MSFILAVLGIGLLATSTYFVLEPQLRAILQMLIDYAGWINVVSIAIGICLLVVGQVMPNQLFTRAGVASIVGIVLISCACGYVIFLNHATMTNDELMSLYRTQGLYFLTWSFLYSIHHFVSSEDKGSKIGLRAYFLFYFRRFGAIRG
jgi:uncharacterized membrane protein YczE